MSTRLAAAGLVDEHHIFSPVSGELAAEFDRRLVHVRGETLGSFGMNRLRTVDSNVFGWMEVSPSRREAAEGIVRAPQTLRIHRGATYASHRPTRDRTMALVGAPE